MTRIEVGEEGEGDAASGLTALVVTVVDLLVEALEHEAVRRMERGTLSDEDVERLGRQLARIEGEIQNVKESEGIEEDVDELRDQLDGIVNEAIQRVDEDWTGDGGPPKRPDRR